MGKFKESYYDILRQLGEDIQCKGGEVESSWELVNSPEFNALERYKREVPEMTMLARLMVEMETRQATKEECRWARSICGTWLDLNYWRMYCMSVAVYWEKDAGLQWVY